MSYSNNINNIMYLCHLFTPFLISNAHFEMRKGVNMLGYLVIDSSIYFPCFNTFFIYLKSFYFFILWNYFNNTF